MIGIIYNSQLPLKEKIFAYQELLLEQVIDSIVAEALKNRIKIDTEKLEHIKKVPSTVTIFSAVRQEKYIENRKIDAYLVGCFSSFEIALNYLLKDISNFDDDREDYYFKIVETQIDAANRSSDIQYRLDNKGNIFDVFIDYAYNEEWIVGESNKLLEHAFVDIDVPFQHWDIVEIKSEFKLPYRAIFFRNEKHLKTDSEFLDDTDMAQLVYSIDYCGYVSLKTISNGLKGENNFSKELLWKVEAEGICYNSDRQIDNLFE